jgi:hypothetical protein
MRSRRLSPLRLAALLGCLATAPLAAAPTICDGTSALTLLGMDTAAGRMLFSLPPLAGHGGPWIVELDAAGRTARAWGDPPKGLQAGSVGPGPVLAALPCGTSCLQPVRFRDGTWEPLGDPITMPQAATASATYDHGGTPWFVLHGATQGDGQVKAWAFHLEGSEWKPRGALTVSAVGQPQVLPAPQRRDGVLTGSGLFSASGPPESWVVGLPSLPPARRGQVLALTGSAAFYVSADGVVYLSSDGGRSWRRSVWTPWGNTDTAGIWRQGSDYGVDLPTGDYRGTLRLVWFDRRVAAEEKVVLTRLGTGGDWVRLAEAPAEVHTKSGDRLPVAHVLVPSGDAWLLLSGCAATAEGSGLVLRQFDGKSVSAPRFVPIAAAGGAKPRG